MQNDRYEYKSYVSVQWYRNMYNITDHEVCAESVLLNHGGVKEKDLTKIISNDLNADDAGNDDEIDTMSHSPYFCLAIYQTT